MENETIWPPTITAADQARRELTIGRVKRGMEILRSVQASGMPLTSLEQCREAIRKVKGQCPTCYQPLPTGLKPAPSKASEGTV